jgi:hypothetical protein
MFVVAADAHAQVCNQYVALERLPDRFVEVASGLLTGGVELFVYSDGRCTCDNTPYVERKLGKPATKSGLWSCREATADERGVSN